MLMISGNFNPAFYVQQDSDGEKYLPTHALMAWLNATRPGWRVTSDGVKIFRMSYVDANGNTKERYLGVGHVAVVNSKGVRVISVPVSTHIVSPDFAEDLFDAGARLALETLGYNIMNITHAQWNEVTVWRSGGVEKKKPEGGILSNLKNSLFGGDDNDTESSEQPSATPNTIVPPFSVIGAGEEALDLGDGVQHPNDSPLISGQWSPENPEEIPEMDKGERYARELFDEVCRKSPAIKQKFGGSFEKFCLSVNGFTWVEADNNERTRILDKLNSMVKR